MNTYEIREIESKRLREYLETLSTTEHRFFVSDVIEKCGRGMSKKTFYNWKYGLCRIPLFAKKIIEETAGQTIFIWSPEFE
ncbi:MAG: hypothetical protein IKL83_07560 [Muribaculaceae bacterium]|nr:hypothetical protein [Muribaculaceae bacterium]